MCVCRHRCIEVHSVVDGRPARLPVREDVGEQQRADLGFSLNRTVQGEAGGWNTTPLSNLPSRAGRPSRVFGEGQLVWCGAGRAGPPHVMRAARRRPGRSAASAASALAAPAISQQARNVAVVDLPACQRVGCSGGAARHGTAHYPREDLLTKAAVDTATPATTPTGGSVTVRSPHLFITGSLLL